jgi:CRISPR/Cas system-associated endonuclease Cas1
VCDFEEIYRYLVDGFVIDYCRNVGLSNRDFVLETEDYSSPRKKGMRQYLNENKTRDITSRLNKYFETKVSIPRIKRGRRQEIETLINEEGCLFAQYLRNEKKSWIPRIASLI